MSATFQEKYGPWAVIAGASEGLGAAFAEELGRRGLKLVLVARRADALAELASGLRGRHGVEVATIAVDLGRPDLLDAVRPALAGREVGLLVYNAAYSAIGEFLSRPVDDALRSVDVNCRGPVILSHELGQGMARRGRGGIVLMSSMAGTQGTALIAAYSASKAFNLVLAEALWDELRGRGVDVLACRAGSTRTPGYLRSKPAEDFMVMPPEAVVAETLAALERRGGPALIPGLGNRIGGFLLGHLVPRRLAVEILGRTTRRMYRQVT